MNDDTKPALTLAQIRVLDLAHELGGTLRPHTIRIHEVNRGIIRRLCKMGFFRRCARDVYKLTGVGIVARFNHNLK